MSTLVLAWRLARAGGRFRTSAIIAGNGIGAALFLLAFAIPGAVAEPGVPADREEALLARSVVGFLCLPVALLLLSIGRLSASTRDRRLASLRMLGLTPARTRLVAAVENALFATVGVLLGLMAYLFTAPVMSTRVVDGPGWLRQPLHLSASAVVATCAGVVLLSAVVSLAPARSLQGGHLRLRRDGSASRPSAWRLAPLASGVAILVAALCLPAPATSQEISQDAYGGIVLAGAVLTGLGIAMALPLAVYALAASLSRRPAGVGLRLAANRLICEPASTVRVVSGVAVVAFLVTSSVGIMAAFASTPEYQAARHAYEEGPQEHILYRQFLAHEPMAPPLTDAQIRRIEATPGILAVIPESPVDGSCDPGRSCEPNSYRVLSGPGQAPRDALAATAANLPQTLELDYLDPYWNQQRLRALLWTLAMAVTGVGLLSTLLTALDRAIERRRQIASQVVLGVRLRLLRGSQLLQTLIPLWLAMVAAIGLGFLPLVAILRLATTVGAAPVATVAVMAIGALAAALLVALATLPGIGGRLTPDLLRRE